MPSGQIYVISKREDVVRFFELEARAQGFRTVAFYEPIEDASACRLCVIDTYSIEHVPSVLPQNIVVLSSASDSFSAFECEHVLYSSFPMSARLIANELWRIAANADHLVIPPEPQIRKNESTENTEDKIYFSKDSPNTVRYMGRHVSLSEYEARLLLRLCSSVEHPVSRKELNALLGADDGNIADVYICKLRKKLEEVGEKRIIYTVRSQGYKIITDMEWE